MDRVRFTRAVVLTAAVVLLIDQVSKALVRGEIGPGTSVTVIGNGFHLVNARNPGVAGGLLAGAGVVVVVLVSTAALGGLLIAVRTLGPQRWLWLPVGLILGGGLGNLLDRLRAGAVTDFLVIGHGGPANLADQAITLGVVGLLLLAFLGGRGEQRTADAGA